MAKCVNRSRSGGFTLIELLVVVMIIALGAGVVSLAVGDKRIKEMRTIAERFSAVAELAAEEAALGGEPMGLEWLPPEGEKPWRYRWYRFRDEQWIDADRPLLETALPPYVEVILEVDGVEGQESIEDDDTTELLDEAIEGVEQGPQPEIVFFTSGEATPFELEFNAADLPEHNQHIKVDLLGRIIWQEAQSENTQPQG
ncbi:MAG: type II secretion system minor pseudopilin GspH [Exilibacterium sp.]